MNYYGFVSLFNGVVALLIGLYLLFKNPRNPLHLGFAFFAIPIAFWAILYAVWQSQTEKSWALFFMRWTMVPCYFIPSGFLWFSQHAAREDFKPRRFWPYAVIPGFFAAINFTPWMIEDVVPQLYFPYWPKPGWLMHLCIALFNAAVCYSFYLLFRAWSRAKGMRRWQIKWVTLTTLLAWAGGSTNWFLWYNIPIPPIPNFFVAIFLLFLAYAVIQRQLFDPDALAKIVQEAKLAALGMMAASLNHELRNPLYIAKGRIESQLDNIERGLYPTPDHEIKQTRQALHSALEQLSRAMDIMQRFSDFAKPNADLHREEVALQGVLDDVTKLVSSELAMEKIVVDFSVSGEKIFANRRQLEEIFFNLIVNACHAMGKRGGELSVRASRSNGKVIVEIEDSGPGIPADRLAKIFEPFYTTKEEGTGLGLYIVKQLVERNGGKISVRSRSGEGTIFTLEFRQP